MKRISLFILAMLAGLVAAEAWSQEPASDPQASANQSATPKADYTYLTGNEVIVTLYAELNQQRAKAGLQPVIMDQQLVIAMQMNANRMASQGSMYHHAVHSDNCVAYGQPNARSAIRAWMNSSGHRAHLMNRGRLRCGIGGQRGRNGRWYWAAVFR